MLFWRVPEHQGSETRMVTITLTIWSMYCPLEEFNQGAFGEHEEKIVIELFIVFVE